MAEFRMPSLGADMDRGTLLEWRVGPGDPVTRGDIIAVIDTDKSDIEVEVFESGIVEELLVAEGTEVAVGTPLARIGPARTAQPNVPAVDAMAVDEPALDTATAGPPTRGPAEAAVQIDEPAAHPPVFSPLVRHRAEELGVDLADVTGTGPGGVITRADVDRVAPVPAAPADVVTPATRPTPPSPSSPAERPTPPERSTRPGRPAREGEPGTRSSPYARRRAAEAGIDLADIVGTGPGGAVVTADVELAGAAPAPAVTVTGPADVSTIDAADHSATGPATESASESANDSTPGRSRPTRQQAMRQAVARLMARSKREIPHYYLSTTIDLAPATEWLTATNAERAVGDRILPAALLLKATAVAAGRVPEINGHWIDDAFVGADQVDLGVAVSLRGGGLVAPAIRHADELTVDELMAVLRDLVTRARAGSLRSSEMTDPSITVTNLGDQGVEAVFGVIYPPQVALVGFGKIVERPWAANGMLGIHPCVTATLAADHRASDGHRGATFLATIDRLLADPGAL